MSNIWHREFSRGTYLDSSMPFGLYVGGAAMCSDGKVRKLARISQVADTFFSIPAAVRVKGRYVSGYVSVETQEGWSVVTDDDPLVVKFIAYKYGKNSDTILSVATKGLSTCCS